MVGRRRAATAFRPSAPTGPARSASRGQTVAMLLVVLLVAAGVSIASFVVKPDKARSFDLFYGSVYIDDNLSPVAVDLSSGKATVRLSDAPSAVSAERSQDLDMVPLAGGTLMLDPLTGEFNMLDNSGFVVKPDGGGVRLPQLSGSENATTTAVPAGDSAYLVRPGASGTAVYLVGQSTVAAAIGVSTPPKARAEATLKLTATADADTMTGANGQLFLLGGTVGRTRHLLQLSVPSASNAGVHLNVRERHAVTGVAALASATLNPDGTGGDSVGLATPDQVRVITPDGAHRVVPVHSSGTVDSIVPVRNAQGSLEFLYHSSSAWSLVHVPTDGTTSATTSTIKGIDANLGVITPVAGDGDVFTMTRDSYASLYDIHDDGTATSIKGAAHYPLVNRERLNLSGAEVIAKGSRVIFDSRANFRAVVVFADGSHPPRIVDKHSAVQVDTNGTASISGDDKPKKTNPKTHTPNKPKPKPQSHPVQPVNNKINCKIVSQTPHIPSVQLVQRASRSVQLQWEYPLLDPQDCDPSTYTVAVRADSSGAPPAPSTVTVQGQDGINLTGLFPDTTYSIVVTAYINKLHTSSQPLVVKTSIEGPAAPTNIHTGVDSSGNWTISWNSCGGVSSGCVPTADWQIVPKICDGVGLSATPDTRRRVGDPTQHSFSYTYEGSETLLGRGLSFEIQGIGEKGTIGDSAGDHTCSYSWTPPVPGDIHLHASAPPMTSGETTSHTDVSVSFDGGQQHDLGGVGGQLTYELLQGGSVVAKIGPTNADHATLPGISAGRTYQAAVIVNPARHPDSTARIGPIDVKAAVARWPQPTISASFHPTSAYFGTLAVQLHLPAGTDTHGETFDTSQLDFRCSNADAGVAPKMGIKSGDTLLFTGIDRTQVNSLAGKCYVRFALVQNARTITDPPVYGDGTTSPVASVGGITVDAPSLTAGQGTFGASWNSSAPLGQPQANASYTGDDQKFLEHANYWRFQVSNNGGSRDCGSSTAQLGPSNTGVTLNVSKDCIRDGGSFSVTVAFTFYGQRHTVTVDINGSKPSPVDASKFTVTAQWTQPLPVIGVSQVQVNVDSPYQQQQINTLSWSYSLSSDESPGVECLKDPGFHDPPNALGPGPKLDVRFKACPTTDGTTAAVYTLTVTFHDPNYGVNGGPYHATVDGTPHQ